MLDRITAPAIKTIDRIEFQEPEIRELSNGIKVLGFNLGSQEVVQIELNFFSGTKNVENNLIASYTSKMLGEASENFEEGKIMDQIDYYGAFLESSSGQDLSQITLFSLEKHLKSVLPIFSEVVNNPIFPEKILDIHLKNGKQKFHIQNEKVGFRCRNLFNQELLKDHPYGTAVTESSYDNVLSSDLTDYYKNNYHAANCFIVVAGKFTDSLYEELEKNFGKIEVKTKNSNLGRIRNSEPHKVFEQKEGAIQSGIRIGKLLDVEYGSTDYHKLKVLNTVLGGYFGSRLMANIREDKGYTYGIGSAVASFLEASFFVLSTEVGAEVTEAALNEIYKELEKIRETLIPEAELEMVKNYMLGDLLKSSDGPFSMADKYKSAYVKGMSLSYYDDYIHTINTITADELKEIANKYLSADSFLEVVVGNK